ncbi:rhamnulokinase family protein [Streptomyces sp. QL37]|uniref:rhamnulokinase n=1 Tax=Streptomyces sp. QL37 TaxID=2093747 RepID=UPI000CF2E126|nr:rhamnulokinase family protein [Streptomyces sp. QL37]PPQ56441.1 rhamnulokinase [Streptomyces sp. QL37]
MTHSVAAVDLGATSGRVMLGTVTDDRVSLREIRRFSNTPVQEWQGARSTLRWNIGELHTHIMEGLREAVRLEPGLSGLAVDSWGVDYGLVRRGALVDDPFHYRDPRTAPVAEDVHQHLRPADLYRRSGVQPMAINTLYQLVDDRRHARLKEGDSVLLIPQLVEYLLTGVQRAEPSIASTTGLLDVNGAWDGQLARSLGLPDTALPPLVGTGHEQVPVLADVGRAVGNERLMITSVASHDTACAVAATPLRPGDAYISCGTWGLAGVELETPLVSEDAYQEGFTNEVGHGGRVCFQRNLMGLWLLNECVRRWNVLGDARTLPQLLAGARAVSARPVFDVDDPVFSGPGDMPQRIVDWYDDRGLEPPRSQTEIVRSIVDSLAESFSLAVEAASRLTGRSINRIHVVGGGSRNALLREAIAERSGLQVLAGPAEATALGNVLIQAAAAGHVSPDPEALRALAERSFDRTL